MKKILIALLCVVLMASLIGCAGAEEPKDNAAAEPAADETEAAEPAADETEAAEPAADESGDDDGLLAGIIACSATVFYNLTDSGVTDVIEAAGGTVIRGVSEFDIQEELAIVENFLLQGIDVLFISVADAAGSVEAIAKCNDANVPVVCVASQPVESDEIEYLTVTKSDDIAMSEGVAEYLLKQIDYSGDVAIIDGPQITCVLERMQGFNTAIDKYEDVNLVTQTMVAEHTVAGNVETIENLIQGNPDLKIIFTYCGYGIMAASTALTNLDRTDILIGEVDGIPEETIHLAEGTVKGATGGQYPYNFGTKAAEIYLEWVDNPNMEIDQVTIIPYELVTNENAADFSAYDKALMKY